MTFFRYGTPTLYEEKRKKGVVKEEGEHRCKEKKAREANED
jgi:hypothetical protein